MPEYFACLEKFKHIYLFCVFTCVPRCIREGRDSSYELVLSFHPGGTEGSSSGCYVRWQVLLPTVLAGFMSAGHKRVILEEGTSIEKTL